MKNEKSITIEDKKVFYSKKGLANYINMDVKNYIDTAQKLVKNLNEFITIKQDKLTYDMAIISKLEDLKKKTKGSEKKAISHLLTSLKNVTGVSKPLDIVNNHFNNVYSL